MAQPTNTDELREAIRDLRKPDKFLSVEPVEAELQDLIDLFSAYTEREKTAARVEAYKHILLSDNGMQEPLRSWLESYISALTGGSDE